MNTARLLSKVELANSEFKICEFPGLNVIRRSVEDLQSRLLLRSLDRKAERDADRVRTARDSVRKPVPQFNNPPNSGRLVQAQSTTSRMTLSVVGTTQQPEKKQSGAEDRKKRILSLRKTANNYIATPEPRAAAQDLKIIFQPKLSKELTSSYEADEFLLRNSARIRLLHMGVRPNKTIFLVIPVQFILNENNFWKEEQINDEATVYKIWKKLYQIGNIIWIVKSPKSLRKLSSFVQKYSLNLDAVYLVQPKKKQRLQVAVSFKNMQKDLQIVDSKKLIVFNYVNCPADPSPSSYDSIALEEKLPLTNHKYTYLHLIKTPNATPVSTLANIPTILSTEPTLRVNLESMWAEYTKYIQDIQDQGTLRKKRVKLSLHIPEPVTLSLEPAQPRKPLKYSTQKVVPEEFEEDESQSPEEEVLTKIEELKREWIGEIQKMRSYSSAPPSQQGLSVQYLVGDMLRRNFHLMVSFNKKYRKRQNQGFRVQQIDNNSRLVNSLGHSRRTPKINYNVPVFAWKF